MNVFREIVGAMAGPKAYPGFLKNSKVKVFGYVLLVVTLGFLLGSIRSVVVSEIFIGGLGDLVRENVPDFSLEDGEFHMEKTYELEEEGIYILLDSEETIVFSATETEWRQIFIENGYSSVMLADADGILVFSNGRLQTLAWPENFSISRDKLISLIPFLSAIVMVVSAFSYLWSIAFYFFSALFVALIAMAVTSSMKHQLTFGKIYLLSLYGKTMMFLVSQAFRLIGLSMLLGLWVLLGIAGFAVSCVYVCQAISLIQKQKTMGQDFFAAGQQGFGS